MTGAPWDRGGKRGQGGNGKRLRGVVVPRVVARAEPPPPVCFICRILGGGVTEIPCLLRPESIRFLLDLHAHWRREES